MRSLLTKTGSTGVPFVSIKHLSAAPAVVEEEVEEASAGAVDTTTLVAAAEVATVEVRMVCFISPQMTPMTKISRWWR